MDRRIMKTKEAIQNAYTSLIIEKKTPKLSVSEIARRANIDRKTFYLHYETVENLEKEVIGTKLKAFEQILQKNGFFENPFNTYLFFDSINYIIKQNLEIHICIAKSPDFNYFFQKVENILVQTIVEKLSEMKNISKCELEIFCRFYSAGITNVYMNWLKNSFDISIEELAKVTSQIVRFGIHDVTFINPIDKAPF